MQHVSLHYIVDLNKMIASTLRAFARSLGLLQARTLAYRKPHWPNKTNPKGQSCCCGTHKSPATPGCGCGGSQDIVKNHYTNVAVSGLDVKHAQATALKCGYTEEDLKLIPPEACLGLGCGNSVAAAKIQKGEKILDLGCGAGMDLFLAGAKVGPEGKAVGVDFSDEMIRRGREVAAKYGRTNVEFCHSPIDKMTFADQEFDVTISNCVLNLVPDKQKAFSEIYRVLKSKGRFVVSDIVLKKPLPDELRRDMAAIVGCVGRAVEAATYKTSLEKAGFVDVSITDEKKDLMTLYRKPGFGKNVCEGSTCCCGTGTTRVDTKVIDKYDLNEYAMSCIVRAHKPT